jgi:hemerythrin-like domain-containing protein
MAGPLRAFRFIHNAIRAELQGLEEAAQGLDPTDEARCTALVDQLAFFRDLLKSHEGFEEQVVFADLDQRAPHVATAYRLDHRSGEHYLEAFASNLQKIQKGRDRTERTEPLVELNRTAIGLRATMRLHVDKEDEHIIPVAEEYFSPAEQGGMLARMGEFFPPATMMEGMVWISSRLTNEGREDLFRTYQAMMPPPVYTAIVQYVAPRLPAADWEDAVRRIPDLATVAGTSPQPASGPVPA